MTTEEQLGGKAYLEALFEQLTRDVQIKDTDSFTIQCNDGDPAIVTVRSGTCLSLFVQDEELTKLHCEYRVNI
jgi:hypothetical protein